MPFAPVSLRVVICKVELTLSLPYRVAVSTDVCVTLSRAGPQEVLSRCLNSKPVRASSRGSGEFSSAEGQPPHPSTQELGEGLGFGPRLAYVSQPS